MGKCIYQPRGRAREYSPWACNLYNGCTNRCDYCYNRHCQAKGLLGKDEVTLKSSLVDEDKAYDVFCAELCKYKRKIIGDGRGLFFNFVSDPCLPETIELNFACIHYSGMIGVPCVILTKRADWLTQSRLQMISAFDVEVGVTLTGCDGMEPYASTNSERIALLRTLHENRVRTWASIEPVIDIGAAKRMFDESYPYCDHYKIGLLSGRRGYVAGDVLAFYEDINSTNKTRENKPIYWKDSVRETIGKMVKQQQVCGK